MYKFKRGKNKIATDFGVPDIYKFYTKQVEKPVSKKTFKDVLTEYNNEILRMIIFDGLDYSMSHRIGSIRIRKFDNSLKLNDEGEVANKLKVDWGKTLKRWREMYGEMSSDELKEIPNKPMIYHLNEHSDGYVFKWYWDKVTSNLKNQSAYKFKAVRDFRRIAAQAWKSIPELKDLYYE